jgi:putative tricarboxylic transport membrane protein
VFLLVFGLSGIKLFAKLVEVRKGLLLPIIIMISVIGTYAINNSIYDVYWMLGFGMFGYFLKLYGFQAGPVILGVILGPLMETGYRQAMADQHNSVLGFLTQLIVNPLSLVLTLSMIFMVLGQTQFWAKARGWLWQARSVTREEL